MDPIESVYFLTQILGVYIISFPLYSFTLYQQNSKGKDKYLQQ